MSGRGRLLFVSTNYSSFVRQDAEMLSKNWELERFEFGSKKGVYMLLRQLSLFFWLLVRIWKAEAIFIWFADYHAFLPTMLGRIFGKKVFLVLGGYDVAKMPEYNYGGHVKSFRSWIIRSCCKWATHLLPVSAFVEARLGQLSGSRDFAPRTVIHNGVDLALFPQVSDSEEIPRNGIVCVGLAETKSRVYIKGLDRFAEVAKAFPETNFTVIGCIGEAADLLKAQNIQNLEVLPPVPREELLDVYHRAQAICQFSRFESFGMALAEGMLCGCVPVTIAGLGAAEVVSEDSGFIAADDSIDALIAATKAALTAEADIRKRATLRVQQAFSLQKRGKALDQLLG